MGKSVVLAIITLGIILAFATYIGRQTFTEANPKTGAVGSRVSQVSITAIVQSINTAQATYNSRYPDQGYAASLAALGPGGATDCKNADPPASAEHACLMPDPEIGKDTCSGESWCDKDGYSFRLSCGSSNTPCNDYVVVAIPANANSAMTTAYCSTSDSMIHTSTFEPSASSAPANISPDECRAWQRM